MWSSVCAVFSCFLGCVCVYLLDCICYVQFSCCLLVALVYLLVLAKWLAKKTPLMKPSSESWRLSPWRPVEECVICHYLEFTVLIFCNITSYSASHLWIYWIMSLYKFKYYYYYYYYYCDFNIRSTWKLFSEIYHHLSSLYHQSKIIGLLWFFFWSGLLQTL